MPLDEETDRKLTQLAKDSSTPGSSAGGQTDRALAAMAIRAQHEAADALKNTAEQQEASSKWMKMSVFAMFLAIAVNVLLNYCNAQG